MPDFPERWLPISGASNYEVSSLGRVRGFPRNIMRKNGSPLKIPGRIFSHRPACGDYIRAWIRDDSGRLRLRLVHVLVAEAFLGPCPVGCEVAHWNGERQDPRLSNLRYDTPKGNAADKKRHGTWQKGESHVGAKLTAAQVAEIRRRAASEPQKHLATEFGVSRQNIYMIASGPSWRAA